MPSGSVRGWLRCTRSAVQKKTSPFLARNRWYSMPSRRQAFSSSLIYRVLVVAGEVHPLGAVLEQVVRQAVAAVVEGEFAAALLHILQRDPGGDQQQRVLDRDHRGVLVDAMAVAALKQQLLAGDRLGVEHQRQEARNPRVQADLARRRQVDVEVEQAFEPVRRRLPDSFRRDLLLRWSVVRNFPGCLWWIGYRRRTGRSAQARWQLARQPAMVDEMGEVVALLRMMSPASNRPATRCIA